MPQSQPMRLLTSSDSSEWYTPARYIEAVRRVFGGTIDLDPASCAKANEIVQAIEYFTSDYPANGALGVDWFGRVYCNPLYGKNSVGQSWQGLFAAKLAREYEAGRVKQAIILVNLYFSYDWFEPLRARPLCLTDHRIRFINGETGKAVDAAKASSAFIYFGSDPTKFYKEFSEFGFVGQLCRC